MGIEATTSEAEEGGEPRPDDARLQRLLAYWNDRRGDRSMPSRAIIDPLDFAYILGNVVLFGVERDPLRFRIRLQGSTLVQRLGFDLTGRLLDDLTGMPNFRDLIKVAATAVVAAGRPIHRRRNMIMDDRLLRYEALLLPLGTPEGAVEHVLIGCLMNGA
ncbi:MAG: PAS domain-containing protein [Alphaproteobacteria bacterium]|nr:PAS domain-containing protein [Alphaproteobacteria bacterium]